MQKQNPQLSQEARLTMIGDWGEGVYELLEAIFAISGHPPPGEIL